jgi:hypothetical protein
MPENKKVIDRFTSNKQSYFILPARLTLPPGELNRLLP